MEETKSMNMVELLKMAVQSKASDLHIAVGSPPKIRVNGSLKPVGDIILTPEMTKKMTMSMMKKTQWDAFHEKGEYDFSYGVSGLSRFRVNAFKQRDNYSIACRAIPHKIPNIDDLGLPGITKEIASRHQGLFLVTGPTGSGKSTSLAAMIDYINRTFDHHIITLEDPIEFMHRHQRSTVNQREVGADTQSFANGLRAALRQDPDVILVGEMRDLETISIAITAAETGHLVFGTLHTSSAEQTIDRIIDVFPPEQQQQVRIQLASNLLGVLSQRLLPTLDGNGRVASQEIMINTPAIANLIRQGKVHQIKSMMQTGGVQFGMQTMEQCLKKLIAERKISAEKAKEYIPQIEL